MKKRLYWKLGFMVFTVILSFYFLVPNTPIHRKIPHSFNALFPDRGFVLGLDLQGGTHLIFEAHSSKAEEIMYDRLAQSIKGILQKKKITADVVIKNNVVEITPSSMEIETIIKDNYPDILLTSSASSITVRHAEKEIEAFKENATEQALETIRNRIDQFGVTEPTIQRQGRNEIVVQLPGIKDPRRAIEIIGKTALLEFKLLDEESNIPEQFPSFIKPGEEEEFLKRFEKVIPSDDEIVFQRSVDSKTGETLKRPFLVKRQTLLTGDLLTDARVQIDSRFNEPYVSLSFNPLGSKIFEEITTANVNKRLAIILDGNLYSAPVIREPISGGDAQITGDFTMEEAKDLSIVLRAGALPVPMRLLENVTVGPSLGKDSIEAGKVAGIAAFLLVFSFMILYYRLSGLVADIALIMNLILLLGAMAMLKATLTLPGIAGIILAIGMAVDTNVLMFERIREELRLGKTPRAAVESGYKKAFWTIFDSHITTLITAAVLFQFGTGPIKGFAVTLSIGVSINLFTSLIGTKTIFDLITTRRELRRLSI